MVLGNHRRYISFEFKMKTSASQFLMLIDFMERHGDLNKPAEGPYGRLQQIEKWAELERCLNIDISGECKSIDKWKRVWSDLKNNTKRKAAKIYRATGGGPPCKLILSDLELRVLNIIGSQAASGLVEIDEAGASPPGPVQIATPLTSTSSIPMIHIQASPLLLDGTNHLLPLEGWSEAATSSRAGITQDPQQRESPQRESPQRETPQRMIPQRETPRGLEGRASPRRSLRRRSGLRRSAPRASRVDAATRHFQSSDECWRNIFSELATEHLRLRRQEMETQVQWQAIVKSGLDILKDYLKK